jgi:uncharacterized protein
MQRAEIIQRTINFVQQTLADSESGHDWWHIFRVYTCAKRIAQNESGANLLVVELAALLHDIADSKFHNGNEELAPQISGEFLRKLEVDEAIINQVINIIKHVSYKHQFGALSAQAIELQIVQDADRLDAMGAIGIARAFSYGGYKKREMYNPEIKPVKYNNSEEYKNNTAPTINHFYEKLLLLKASMNTEYGKKMASERHKFMEEYLEQFYAEWEGRS